MAAGVLEQLPQFLGAAAAFMLGWAACDWVKTRQANKAAAGESKDEIESSAGDAEPINAGADDVTKVNISGPQTSEPDHALSMDAAAPEEGQQAVATDVIVERSADAGQLELAEADPGIPEQDEPVYQDRPIARDDSVRVLDTLIAVENAE